MANQPIVKQPDNLLSSLKRFDGDVEDILASSSHVVLYTMTLETQQWTRKNVEGSLFLLKRRSAPRFQLMVLNKATTENFVEDVHNGLEFELNPPYLMYTRGNSEIMGVWFYEQADLPRVEEVLKRIKKSDQPPDALSAVRGAPRSGGGQALDSDATGPAAPPAASAAPAKEDDDSSFWDKPKPAGQGAAQQRQLEASPLGGQAEGISNLEKVLRNAHLKQQATEVPVAGAPPQGPLPPSFFAQLARPQAIAQPPHPHAPLPQPLPAVHAPLPAQQPIPLAASPQAAQAQRPAEAQLGGGSLAKLFANANKGMGPAQQWPQAGAAAAPPAPGPQALGQQPAGVTPATNGGSAALSDEEKVRRLLIRLSTNEVVVKMLAGEMRAVGIF